MSDQGPSFDELLDDSLTSAERTRLRAAHDLVIAAGPPPELPPSLVDAPPEPPSATRGLLRRRRFTVVAAAAAVALGVFATGYSVGLRGSDKEPLRTVEMTGTGGARASLDVLPRDTAGNWPMRLRASGLDALPPGATYELWLTRAGELAAPCGTFTVAAGTTDVPLNAPYPLREYDGWVVVRSGTTGPFVLTTSET